MSVAALRIAARLAAYMLIFFVEIAFAQGYQTRLQVSPQGGGKCVDVANREFIQDQQLQMMDCNNSTTQIFTHDQAKMVLIIGGLCVDANGGQPGDLVKLWPCDGGANQVWKVEQAGNFSKLVGVNGLCFDIRYGSTENGARLQSWTCGDAEPNQLWSFQPK